MSYSRNDDDKHPIASARRLLSFMPPKPLERIQGAGAHPLFCFLAEAAPGLLGTRRIKWNFTKFLIDRGGEVVRRFAPSTKPDELRPAIEAVLQHAGEAVSR